MDKSQPCNPFYCKALLRSTSRLYCDAYLDASEQGLTTPRAGLTQDQTSIWVYEGSEKQCVGFIKRKLRWQTIYQWLGYLVAGGIGAVLTYFLTKLS